MATASTNGSQSDDNAFAISLIIGLLLIVGLFGTKKPTIEPSDTLIGV